LLDYAHMSSFTRSGEASAVDPRAGWAFYDTTTPWPGSNVPRVQTDGAILIEPARTNLIIRSREFSNTGAWSSNSGTITTGQSAPDGTSVAMRVQSSVGGRLGPEQIGSFSGCIASVYARKGPGTGYTVLYTGGTDAGYFAATVGTSFQRIVQNGSSGFYYLQDGRGHAILIGGPGEPATDCDSVLDLAQNEVGAFATSPIRTTTTSVTRNADVGSFNSIPSTMRTGRWDLDFWPLWATSTAPATAYIYYVDASNYLAAVSGTTLRCRAGGSNFDITGLTFTAFAKRTVTVDFDGNTLAISGASSVALSGDWSGAGSTLNVGSDGAANHVAAVLSMARAA